MSNIFLITKREYFTQVRKKSFILLTFLAPFLILLSSLIIAYIFKANDTQSRILVVNSDTALYSAFKNNQDISYSFDTHENIDAILDSLPKSEYLNAVLVLPQKIDSSYTQLETNSKLYFSKNISNASLYSIQNQLEEKIKEIRLKKYGISQQEYELINPNVSIEKISISDSGEHSEQSNNQVKEVFSYILMYVTFMFIIIYGTRVMRNILEEKNNRVVEIIISSVKPFELLLGKVLGTTLVAITQFVIWISMTLLLLSVLQISLASEQMSSLVAQGSSEELSSVIASLWSLNYPLIIFVFLFYFFFGYLFYSSFFAAVGSAVDSETETSQFTPLVIIPLSIAVYGSISIVNNPEGPVAFWMSMIPITSPVAMVSRISFGISAWELLLSMFLLVISTFFMMYIASRIYRVGILMYGKKVTLKEIIKWIRY
ncbi:MAG: ABC transporter permease [Flavobacteriales bacterium]|nr:ABC transporter permease [Flavobacteriales bacterium]